PFASKMQGRTKRPLGDLFGLTNFGVNLTTIVPGGVSALRHTHSKQDEFVYIISGTATLVTNNGRSLLTAGSCAGFKAGNGNAHHILNESSEDLVYLEIGDRSAGDQVAYPDDDIAATLVNGQWHFAHKDGTPY
ncbi:MAG: cupin domain-containing protein, partial [Elusimicrobia bacterium]